ncbi:MAG: amidohydrolase [Lautropia sp.]
MSTGPAPGGGVAAEPIVDAHHHIWRLDDLDWLKGPPVPRIFGEYGAIRRDYPIDEYLDDVAGTGVVRSVYVQTNWPAGRALDEVAWVDEVHAQSGWPHAIVGYADFLDDGVGALLKAQAGCPLVRGIRQQIHWHRNGQYRFAERPDLADDPRWRRNLALLADRGLLFELQVFESQMAGAARLARDLPEVVFVLEHAGMLEDLSERGWANWRDGMRRLADAPNVSTKLSGLGTFVRRNDPDLIARIVEETVAIFGAQRCVWGSNFPVEKLWTDYASLVGAARAALAHLSEDERRGVLADNAIRLYRLDPIA